MNIINFLSNLPFPPRCVFCNNMLEPNHPDSVCAKCRLEIHLCADYLCCKKCGKPVVSYDDSKICYSCLNTKHRYNRAISALVYEGDVRYAVIRNKKRSVKANISEFARLMSLAIHMNYDGIAFDGIVSAPPSKKSIRKNERNHIDPIADELAKLLDLPHFKNCLRKIRKTPRQSSLNYSQRRENLKNSIECKADMSGKTLLFIDDVLTTGSTADECARMLKLNGAKAVYVATLATTVKQYVIHSNSQTD